MSTDPRIDDYIDRAAPFAQPILQRIRDAVHEGCPEAEETIKWGFPHFVHHGILCSMAAFKAHCALGFWKGDQVVGEPAEGAMGQFGRIASVRDLPPRRELVALVRRAARRNEALAAERGASKRAPSKRAVTSTSATASAPAPKRAPRPMPELHPAFAAALERHPEARAAFERFAPSHRREYLEWIGEARQEATRERRIATALEWLAEGKPRNWKHMPATDRSASDGTGRAAARPSGRQQ
jgi:uncharacterized protein YdeI (YjbR/CyaY-like superfamily)